SAVMEGSDHGFRSAQRCAVVYGLLHRRSEAVMGDELTCRVGDGAELVRVDVHQGEGRVPEGGEGEDVADEAEGEHEPAGADDRDLGVLQMRRRHGSTLGAHNGGDLPESLAKVPGSYGCRGAARSTLGR